MNEIYVERPIREFLYLESPGTRWGPCLGGCLHKACPDMHALAAKRCPKCHKRIGYKIAIYVTNYNGTAKQAKVEHMKCRLKAELASLPSETSPLCD